MTQTIALAGKGGVGKTSIAALVIKYLVQARSGTILAIDADPSSNLNQALGVDLEWTVGEIREDMLGQVKESLTAGGAAMGSLPGGISKRDYLDYHIKSSMVEGEQFDLLAMGRSEGAGCYCAVNHNLRQVIDAISRNYQYLVIDNEAGMEHLSRRTTRDVDHLLIISDPTHRGITAARRIGEFRKELDIQIRNTYLIINRLTGELPSVMNEYINDNLEIPLIGCIPADAALTKLDMEGKPFLTLANDSPIYVAVEQIMQKIL